MYLFPYQKLTLLLLYFLFFIILIIQMIKILKNHHKLYGIQNIIFMFLFSWCFMRMIDNGLSFGLGIEDQSKLHEINHMESYQYLIKDIGDIIGVLLFSFFTFYCSFLLYRFEAPKWRNIIALILIIGNTVNVITTITLDIEIFEGKEEYYFITYFTEGIMYLLLFILVIYNSIKIISINMYGLDYYHPKPFSLRIALIILSISLFAKMVYSIASGCTKQSLFSLICSEEYPSSICTDNYEELYYSIGVVEILINFIWELLPIVTIIILYWNVPSLNNPDSLHHLNCLFSVQDESVQLITLGTSNTNQQDSNLSEF